MRPSDQIIVINGVDMTRANHLQVNIIFSALDVGCVMICVHFCLWKTLSQNFPHDKIRQTEKE